MWIRSVRMRMRILGMPLEFDSGLIHWFVGSCNVSFLT